MGPAECPTPVEFHLVVFVDRRLPPVLANPGRPAGLLDDDLEWLGQLAPIAIADPDRISVGCGNVEGRAGRGLVVVGGGGDRQKAAFAPLAPFGGPTRPGKPPMARGFFHLGFSHRPAIAANSVEMLGFEPDALGGPARGYPDEQEHKNELPAAGHCIILESAMMVLGWRSGKPLAAADIPACAKDLARLGRSQRRRDRPPVCDSRPAASIVPPGASRGRPQSCANARRRGASGLAACPSRNESWRGDISCWPVVSRAGVDAPGGGQNQTSRPGHNR